MISDQRPNTMQSLKNQSFSKSYMNRSIADSDHYSNDMYYEENECSPYEGQNKIDHKRNLTETSLMESSQKTK